MESIKKPWGYWTYDRCKEETSKMVYLSELQGKTVTNIIRKNGWYDELTSHLIRVQSKPYTEDQCREESKKYKTRVDFQKKSSSQYTAALRMGILDDVCSHMIKPRNIKQYTKEEIFNSAIKYNNQRDWIKNEVSIFRCALGYKKTDIKFWEKCISHMNYIFNPSGYWTYEKCSKIASKYTIKSEFRVRDRLAYRAITTNGWTDLLSHLEELTPSGKRVRYEKEFDTIEKCKEEALKYETRSELLNDCNLLYKIVRKNKWDDICFAHMKRVGNTSKRFIYAFEFKETKRAYVGLTCNIKQRKEEHLGINKRFTKSKSNVYRHMTENNIWPVFKIITKRPVKEENAEKSEDKWMKHYENNGWELLNIAKAGSLGSPRKRNLEYFQKIKDECSTLSEFMKKTTSHDKFRLKKEGLWNDLIQGLEIDVVYWTKDNILKEYHKYREYSRYRLQKEMSGLFKAVNRYGLMDELFPAKENILTYEYCKEIALQYTTYSEFYKNSRRVRDKCVKEKWFDLTSHMKRFVSTNRKPRQSKYTIDICRELSKGYETRSQFGKEHSAAFKYLRKNNLVDEIFPPKKRVFKSKYTYEICEELSKECKTRSEFQEKYSGAFKYLKKNNLLDKLYPKRNSLRV
jgi:hypothetical protein